MRKLAGNGYRDRRLKGFIVLNFVRFLVRKVSAAAGIVAAAVESFQRDIECFCRIRIGGTRPRPRRKRRTLAKRAAAQKRLRRIKKTKRPRPK